MFLRTFALDSWYSRNTSSRGRARPGSRRITAIGPPPRLPQGPPAPGRRPSLGPRHIRTALARGGSVLPTAPASRQVSAASRRRRLITKSTTSLRPPRLLLPEALG